jgi:hypothetical protein
VAYIITPQSWYLDYDLPMLSAVRVAARSRRFASSAVAVEGFTGAVGNTPLVSLGFHFGPALINAGMVDLPQRTFREDWLKDLWKGGISEPRRECERSCRPRGSTQC